MADKGCVGQQYFWRRIVYALQGLVQSVQTQVGIIDTHKPKVGSAFGIFNGLVIKNLNSQCLERLANIITGPVVMITGYKINRLGL